MPVFTIDAESWAALNRLLDTALDLPEPQRLTWVQNLGPEYDDLKPRLRDLLQRSGPAGTVRFLNTIPKIDAGMTASSESAGPPALRPGGTIGPYRLESELGQGGMGLVWLAMRSDGMVNRPVALKLPRGMWRLNALAERMAREREILASLTHPNIARLYDAGLTDDGQPWLALEYVEGIRIDEYCRSANLDVKGRLTVFLQVVSAVAYAHSQLVVHRDLKPSNILVTKDGEVRLLDFGIAKLLEDGHTNETELTEFSGRALTPDYASPEQIAGKPIGTASDVYSLGVVLCELLTGKRPYDLKRQSRGALEDAILQSEPARPSDAAQEPSFRKALRGDLDWIVLKCLAKDREQRYPSASALHEEIGRYLRHEPVEAGSPSAMYRISKFVRRHRAGVAAAAIVALALIGGLTAATAGLLRARDAEAAARAEAATAVRVSGFLVNLFENATPEVAKGREVTAREILDRGTAKIRGSLADEPLVRARLLRTIGYVYTNLGLYPEARPPLEEAVKLARDLGGRGREELGIALHRLANLHRLTGEAKKSEAEFRESIAILEPTLGPRHNDVGLALNGLALLLRTRDPEEALRLYRRTYDLLVKTHGQENGDAGVVLANIGAIHLRARRYEEARETLEKALPVVIRFHGENDHRTAGILGNLAVVHKELGNHERALDLSRRDLELSTLVLGADHPAIGMTRLNLARIVSRLGDEGQALAETERALGIFRRRFAPAHPLRVAGENTRGVSLLRLGRRNEARAVWSELVALNADSAEARKALLTTHLLLADYYRLSGQFARSLEHTERALADPLTAKDPHLEAEARWTRAYTLAGQRPGAEADAESRRALMLQNKLGTPERVTLFAQAKYYACSGDDNRALELLRTAIARGFRDAAVRTDPAFASLQQHPEFGRVTASMKLRQLPTVAATVLH